MTVPTRTEEIDRRSPRLRAPGSRSTGRRPAQSVNARNTTTRQTVLAHDNPILRCTDMSTTTATTIRSIVLEVAGTASDVSAAEAFYAALGLADRIHVRGAETPTSGFRGYALSLVVPQPGNVDALIRAALDGGATVLKPVTKSFWGYGGVLRAPDGAIWKVASSSKKDTGPAAMAYDDLVLLLGVENVRTTKQFYVEHGLPVAKSFGSKYVEFATPPQSVKFALYSRRAAAKDVGVDPDGSGSHRIAVQSDAGSFTDPDGFTWELPAADRIG